MKGIYKQLKELNLSHIFYMHFVFSFLIGGGAIYILCKIALPHFIPVVVYMMYYFPLARMNMRQYLYRSRGELENLSEDMLFDAIILVHAEWNMEFSKHRWVLRLNILVFCLFIGGLWVFRFCLLNFMTYGDLIFNITSSIQVGLLVWLNLRQSLWLREEIPLGNKKLF